MKQRFHHIPDERESHTLGFSRSEPILEPNDQDRITLPLHAPTVLTRSTSFITETVP
jgi:hypothetical protein